MLIDLTLPLSQDTPVYPGDTAPVITRTSTIADQGYELHRLTLGTHIGTHIDAPAHMLAGGSTMGGFSLDKFVGDGVYIDLTDGDYSVAKFKAAAIGEGSIVICNTGTYHRFQDPGYFTDYPVLSREIADYLVACNVKLVGLDTCSSDNQTDFPIHKILLGTGIGIIENLTNLDSLVGKTFTVYALPLKVDLDGAPARVIARAHDDA